jgi:uncharacterized protein Yka (UPF0111/DUF47 family)
VAVITDLEHQGDNNINEIIAESRRTFFTPFDREDIMQLAHLRDAVTDSFHSVADFMLIYKIEQPTKPARELADVIVG